MFVDMFFYSDLKSQYPNTFFSVVRELILDHRFNV